MLTFVEGSYPYFFFGRKNMKKLLSLVMIITLVIAGLYAGGGKEST